MNLFATPEFKVGALVIAISALIATMSIKVSNDPSGLGFKKQIYFMVDDASGLVKNSNVRMAGIPVGTIRDIRLENGQARVEVWMKGDTPLFKSARVEIRPNGILGDKFVEIMSGDPRDPPLESGDVILVVEDRASVDRLIGEISKIAKSVSDVAENIKNATEGDREKPLGRIIDNIERLTHDVAELTSARKQDISEIILNLRETTDTINDIVNDKGPDGLKSALTGALQSLRRIENTLKNTEEITDKINRGEGTLGKLVNDDTTIEEFNTAVTGIANILDVAGKMQTSVDYQGNYLSNRGDTRSYLHLRLQPGVDRFYEIGIVDDSRGSLERLRRTTTTNGTSTTVEEDTSYLSRFRLNVLFGKNFWNLTVRGGLMENSGGVGVDYHLFRKRLRLSVDLFDFKNTQIRTTVRYNFWSGLYLNAGMEDMAGKYGQATPFVGAGLFLTNDDLRLLLTTGPF